MKNFITCGFVLVALVAISNAYNFDDPDYNQFLARDFEELIEDSVITHPRARRDEEAAATSDKCRKRRPKFCCAEDTLENLHDEDKTLKKECYKEVTGKDKPMHGFHGHHDPFKCDKEKMDKHRREMSCVLKCVGQKKDVIDANGNLKEDNLKKQIKEKFAKEAWLTPKLDAILDKCIAEAKKEDASSDEAKDKEMCRCQGMKFGHCFWKELQTSCPADQIKDQKVCDKVRERIQNSPDFAFPHRQMDDE